MNNVHFLLYCLFSLCQEDFIKGLYFSVALDAKKPRLQAKNLESEAFLCVVLFYF